MKLLNYKKICHNVNVKIKKSKLNFQNFGNASVRIDKDYFVIKPTGINLDKVDYSDYPIISIKTQKRVSGKLIESTDTLTHLSLYKNYKNINSIIHTHSKYAVIFSQSKVTIPILGTTHADYWNENILVTKSLKKSDVSHDYQYNIAKSIIECLKKRDPLLYPGILVANHGPFCWGFNAAETFLNAERLEFIAELAYKTLILNRRTKAINAYLINKHFYRKNGSLKYYGQE
jgi:L-ribulose-5-phosphate 4-epimerase